MKKISITLALMLFAALPLLAEHVDPETARKVATTFFNNNGAKAAQLVDLSKETGFPNLYIFNGNPGFVVMAADDCAQPILGYSLTGKFVAENMPTNVSGWLQGYNDEIQYAVENQVRATTETAQLWKDLIDGNSKAGRATAVVDNLLQTTWNQDPGYNDLCPYDASAGELTVTGCVATAMAQIMKYWEYPNHGVGSHSYTPDTHPEYGVQSVDYGAATYDWANMPLDHANAEIAKLMYHCGVSVDMDYDLAANGGSGAVTAYVVNALQTYYNYQSCTYKEKDNYSSTWVSMLKAELDASRPLQYSGRGTGGHSFVCCGYDNQNKFYFNWGWSGSNDGFYSLSSLNPGSGGAGGGNYIFSDNQAAIFGIQPVQSAADEPSNLNYTLEGFRVTLTWTAGEGAVSYNVYRNGILLDNTTSTTYTDNSINYGTYSYYVKSKDANGSQSLPTNTVTISIEPVPTNLTATLNGNNVNLTWNEPEWSAPQTGDEMLTYGSGNYNGAFGVTNAHGYYGHHYPISMLGANKVLYKVSFYAAASGNFEVYIYSSNSGNSKPQTLLRTKSITTSSTGWCDIELGAEEFVHINNSKDLWVFIYDPEAKTYPIGVEASTNDEGAYYSAQESTGPTNWVGQASGRTILIRTFITDDSFQYNLYDNNTLVVSNLSGSSCMIYNIANNTTHQYTLRTIFNDEETSNSNMAGLSLGTNSLSSLTLNANDVMTLMNGSVLTVTGEITNTDPGRLIIEDGAQLVHDNGTPAVTMKKHINGYTGEKDNYYLITVPFNDVFDPTTATGMVTGNFDLYEFHSWDVGHEWFNYEYADNYFTTMQPGVGYLYAKDTNVDLEFKGTINPSTDYEYYMAFANDPDTPFDGWEIVGNPFACNTYIVDASTTGQGMAFYKMNAQGNNFTAATGAIKPLEGIFVQATAEDQSFTFTRTAPITSSGQGNLNLSLAQVVTNRGEQPVIDNVIIRFDGGNTLEKFSLSDKYAKIYIPQNGKDYAVVNVGNDIFTEIPINFKAAENGTYTLTVSTTPHSSLLTPNSSPLTPHLIDNMTGANIDLLTSPTYTFTAKTTDYESRFRLVFSSNDDMDNPESDDDFAFIDADGNLILNGNGVLQIVDATGRIVVERRDGACIVSTANMVPGVYVLRLITENSIKTQKIIINDK